MQREEFRQLLSNPDALSAMMQIQQGMMRLQTTSPGMLNQAGYDLYSALSLSLSLSPCVVCVSCRLGAGPASATPQQTPPTSGNQEAGITQDMLQQMLSQIMPPTPQSSTSPPQPPQSTAAPPLPGAVGAGLTQQQQAEVLYCSQLDQLANMGFPDRQRNISGKSSPEC